ncbi:MAG: TIGR02147 family protein [Bdellovibrionaceae bacterium]|nr:TIGR02147 family protein [Pseudobdellovibrionaceae bacterium]
MLNIYDTLDYRFFLKNWLKTQKNEGHGLKTKLAQKAGISSTMFSLILSGEKELTLDQAIELIEHLGLSAHEEDYFLEMIEYSRASNYKLKNRLKNNLDNKKREALKLSQRVQEMNELNEAEQSIYYSSWIYSAIRNLVAIEKFSTTQDISEHLQLPIDVVAKAVDFLLTHGLCKIQNHRLTPGMKITFVGAESPYVNTHHQNWRQKAQEKMQHRNKEDYFLTGPISLSEQDAKKIREMFPKLIEEIMKIVTPSRSEKTYCLNIDWFSW